jgi:hypothetical protein
MTRRRASINRRNQKKNGRAVINMIVVGAFLLGMGALYYNAVASNPTVDPDTLCPEEPSSTTVLLVDVTDPMNLPQRQDFQNQFIKLRDAIPRFGKLVVMKVDPVANRMLRPIITRCNPGKATDVSELTSDKASVKLAWEEKFAAPLDRAFEELLATSSAQSSPILESIQSVALTELQPSSTDEYARTLVVASDLLQHTPSISFYKEIPDPQALIDSVAFGKAKTDLTGIKVQLWMLQRGDFKETQPRTLPDLWERMITAQGGQWKNLYRVSG